MNVNAHVIVSAHVIYMQLQIYKPYVHANVHVISCHDISNKSEIWKWCTPTYKYMCTYYLIFRTESDVCPEPMFSRAKRPFFLTDPQKVCKRLLSHILVNDEWREFRVVRVARGHTYSVPPIPARRLEPRMKHVLKPWQESIKRKTTRWHTETKCF